ncbi:hypothetical protein AOLI_G00243260 [Acnodon oligacanthus]
MTCVCFLYPRTPSFHPSSILLCSLESPKPLPPAPKKTSVKTFCSSFELEVSSSQNFKGRGETVFSSSVLDERKLPGALTLPQRPRWPLAGEVKLCQMALSHRVGEQ